MCHFVFVPGRAYSFQYPRHNYRLLPLTTELRRIVVTTVRDVVFEPLHQMTESLNPFLLRGRWLVSGQDLDRGKDRSFYAESMSDIQTLSTDDLEPLRGVEYVVIEQMHVSFKASRLQDAVRFRHVRQSGAICAVLCHGARPLALDDHPSDPQRIARAAEP